MNQAALFDLDDQQPQSWLEAFPWLRGIASGGENTSWAETIDPPDDSRRQQRLSSVASLAMERLGNWTVGQVIPGLAPELDLMRLGLPNRALNIIVREQATTGEAISGFLLRDLLAWRGAGMGTVDAILQGLAAASLEVATPNVVTTSDPTIVPVEEAPRLPGWINLLIDDVSVVAEWHAVVGLIDAHVVGEDCLPGTPRRVVEAQARLSALRTRDVLSEGEEQIDVAVLLDDVLGTLDARAVQILALRLFADRPTTLDEIGRTQGVTRERIRQIEAKASGAVLNCLTEEGLLADVAETVRQNIGTIRPLDELLENVPALGSMVASVGQPAWRVLDRLDDAYEIEDGWCLAPSTSAARAATQTQIEEQCNDHGVAHLDSLKLVLTDHPERCSELTGAWLARCGYIVDGEHVLTRTGSVGDYAASVLSIVGAPMGVQQIVDRFIVERTTNSLRNAISSDSRFERVDRDLWALKEWGLDAYTSIRSLIRDAVSSGGGQALLDDLIEQITGKYTVSANSVVAYASAPPFSLRAGVVRFDDGAQDVRKSPERTHRLFRRPSGWAYRVEITSDHLRGSGSMAPKAVASVLGLQYGESRQLPSPLGEQLVAWTGIQPAFGTIRRFLLDSDVAAGAEAFLVLDDDGSFGFELLPELTGDPLVDATALAAQEPSSDPKGALKSLAAALELTAAVPPVSLIERYRTRGDDDIADLITACRDQLEHAAPSSAIPASDPEVDDILDLL